MRTPRKVCKCTHPAVVHPGTCLACQLVRQDARDVRDRAMDIVDRFFKRGDLTWEEQEVLIEKIDHIVWTTFSNLRNKVAAGNLRSYYQDSIYSAVRTLLHTRHSLELEQQDEDAFKLGDLDHMVGWMTVRR